MHFNSIILVYHSHILLTNTIFGYQCDTGEVELDDLGGDDEEDYNAGEEEEEAFHRGDDDENQDDDEEGTNVHIIRKNKKKDKTAKGKGKDAAALPTDATRHGGMMDELYQLDYEDIVAGMPTRVKYRQVEKEDFGLTAEEILLADDSELNQFVSLKKIAAYREQGTGRVPSLSCTCIPTSDNPSRICLPLVIFPSLFASDICLCICPDYFVAFF